MILFPTRGRPKSLERFLTQYDLTCSTLPVLVILDEDNADAYAHIEIPDHWPRPFINTDARDLNKAVNNAVKAYPDEDYYGIIADDIVPLTYNWDKKLADAASKHNVAWGQDGIWGEKLPTHPFIGGDLVRAWGWFMSPYTNRHCQDFIWKDFADALGIGKFCADVVTEHRHWQGGKAAFDLTYASQPSPAVGHDEYHNKFKGSDTFKSEVERVKGVLGI